VDDDEGVAQTVRDIVDFIELGIEMQWAKSQEEAVELVAKNQYDCILLDRHIPIKVNRPASVEHGDALRQRFLLAPGLASVPIIVMTAYDVGTDRAIDMVKEGVFDYVTKPFKTEGKTLTSVIMRALEMRKRQPPRVQVALCALTVSGLAAFVQVSEGTIRNCYKAAKVHGPQSGEHSYTFSPQDILLIARERAKSLRCLEDERVRWNSLLGQLGQPIL
jgi:CheY-like chemotaxis protein